MSKRVRRSSTTSQQVPEGEEAQLALERHRRAVVVAREVAQRASLEDPRVGEARESVVGPAARASARRASRVEDSARGELGVRAAARRSARGLLLEQPRVAGGRAGRRAGRARRRRATGRPSRRGVRSRARQRHRERLAGVGDDARRRSAAGDRRSRPRARSVWRSARCTTGSPASSSRAVTMRARSSDVAPAAGLEGDRPRRAGRRAPSRARSGCRSRSAEGGPPGGRGSARRSATRVAVGRGGRWCHGPEYSGRARTGRTPRARDRPGVRLLTAPTVTGPAHCRAHSPGRRLGDMDIETFYEQNEARRESAEFEFGDEWTDAVGQSTTSCRGSRRPVSST